MIQKLSALIARDSTYRLVRSFFYIISGVVAGLELYIITALFFVRISCQAYNAVLYQVAEKAAFLGGLFIMPLFFYIAVASASRKHWRHLIVAVVIFLILGVGLYLFAAKSVFYCFLDDMPNIYLYIGPH
ncbi:MAG: hypothetical protein KBC69_01060 [Candidatus Magasanikbacteria bacterium]|nr:hypothetical protein [Candidatus Magasanikbacteria bacterium]